MLHPLKHLTDVDLEHKYQERKQQKYGHQREWTLQMLHVERLRARGPQFPLGQSGNFFHLIIKPLVDESSFLEPLNDLAQPVLVNTVFLEGK